MVQDFSEIPMFHVLDHHNVKIEGVRGNNSLSKVVQDFRHQPYHVPTEDHYYWNLLILSIFFLKYILLPSDFCLHDPLLHGIPIPAWHEDSGKEPNSSPTNL